MPLEKLNVALKNDVAEIEEQGRAKAPERVIVDYVPASGEQGPRYRLRWSDLAYLRMNSNSYLSLSHHPAVLEEADRASRVFGAGPGAVRFIDGTCAPVRPYEARAYTGNGIPYRVPACALITSGTSTIAFPRKITNRLCHHVIPDSIMLAASM